ncbi:MAG: SUMF1/EgtB/PvdO family nonheme iron enzyme [Pyrinomonadaceae bacterium]
MAETRATTLRLFDLAPEERLHESPGHGFRPIIWHLAHIGVFEAYWILQQLAGEGPPDARYERIFDPIKTPREDSKEMPTRSEMEAFLAHVRERALFVVRETSFDAVDPLRRDGYVFDLVLEHEHQHQETLAYLLQLLEAPKRAPSNYQQSTANSFPSASTVVRDMVEVPEGSFQMGSPWRSFAYDNEMPAHVVNIPTFKIDRCLTTNQEYMDFIQAGGYERRDLWSDAGWGWLEREAWIAPRHWEQQAGEWYVRSLFGKEKIGFNYPVCGVSWYEAEAYANYRGKRLPTEAEWEKAASWDDAQQRKRLYAWGDNQPSKTFCNFGFHFWETSPVGAFSEGASAYGCYDMTGNVWEWTSDKFRGYTGFQPFSLS